MWIVSKISGAADVLVAEAIDPMNWLIYIGCVLDELRVVFVKLSDWMSNYSLLWAVYCALMAYRLVLIDKRLGVRPVGIRETIRRALARLVMRASGDQAKTVCGNIYL